jgi:hypothetical protein
VVSMTVVIGSSGEVLDSAWQGVAASYRLRTRREHNVTEMLGQRAHMSALHFRVFSRLWELRERESYRPACGR